MSLVMTSNRGARTRIGREYNSSVFFHGIHPHAGFFSAGIIKNDGTTTQQKPSLRFQHWSIHLLNWSRCFFFSFFFTRHNAISFLPSSRPLPFLYEYFNDFLCVRLPFIELYRLLPSVPPMCHNEMSV